jgi:hypothetical protein
VDIHGTSSTRRGRDLLQIDGPRRKVFIKFASSDSLNKHIRNIQGTKEYMHENVVLSAN